MAKRTGRLLVALVGGLIWAIACGAGGYAADPAVLDIAAVPHVDAAGRDQYRRFLGVNLPRAFAVASNGKIGWFGGAGTVEDARDKAVKSCAAKGASDCTVYAENLRVVWPGRNDPGPAPPPGPLFEASGYAFVPDARYIWRGPSQAAGVYVWGHGKNGPTDYRGLQPQSHVRVFNNAGFDVVRFDREGFSDWPDSLADRLRTGLEVIRKRGWHKLIVGGQSMGGYAALMALANPNLADAVIAVSPAYFGGVTGSDNSALFYSIARAARSPGTRVAIVHFANDTFIQDIDARMALFRDNLPARVGPVLLIDRPAGITGHGGGSSLTFAQQFGECLLHFVVDPVPKPNC